MLRLFSLFCLLFAAETSAVVHYRRLSLKNNESRCLDYVNAMAHDYIPDADGLGGFSVGAIDELSTLLAEVNAPPFFIAEVLYRLRDLALVPPDHPHRPIRRILGNRNLRESLFIFLPEATEALRGRLQGHFDAVFTNLELTEHRIDDWTLGLHQNQPAQPLRMILYGISVRMPVEAPRAERAVRWLGTLVHELSHAAMTNFVSSWLVANQRLFRAGRSLDPYFQEYFRFRGGSWVANRGFFYTLQEALSYRNEARYLLPETQADSDRDELDAELRASAIRQGNAAFLQRHGITSGNIFEWATDVERGMQRTVRRSQLRGASFAR